MDFVDFNLAKKLKEKGFREKCFAIYTPYSGAFKFNEINIDKRPTSYKLNIEEFRECYNYYTDNNIDAPTISQVLDWLRKEKFIYIPINIWENGWYYEVWSYQYSEEGNKYFSIKYYSQSRDYDTYEQATLAGIEYVLDNLI